MTELFGRLAPGVSLEAGARRADGGARRDRAASIPRRIRRRPTSSSASRRLRDQIAAPARTILLVLLAAAAVVFVIACSNVANLILARSVRREGELAVRAALGAGPGALRRTLLAESLVLCGAGAVLGVVLARPFVAMVARYAARFSVRALEVTVDPSVLWVGAGLAMAAAVLLAYVPRLPSPHAPAGLGLASGSVRITPGTNRRLRVFATTPDCVLVRAARRRGHAARDARRPADGEHRLRHAARAGLRHADVCAGCRRRRAEGHRLLPGSDAAHRPAARRGARRRSAASCRGATPAASVRTCHSPSRATRRRTAKRIRARGSAIVAPHFFAVLGIPMLAGRDFTDEDRSRRRAGGDRQPERRAAAVPERRRGEPADVVDRSVLRQQAAAAPHRRRGRRRGRRERGAADRR